MPSDSDLRARVEQLEADYDALSRTLHSADGGFHQDSANGSLMAALSATRIEQRQALGGLAVQVTELHTDMAEVKGLLRRAVNIPDNG